MKKLFLSLIVWSIVFSFILVSGALADSTIGTNMSTTGTLTVNKSDSTAIRFQNGSGTNLFVFDTSSSRFGINFGSLDTKFEVGGTASATNLMISGAGQFAGNVSVAYSRFGTDTTNHGLSSSNDLLITGFSEFQKRAYFDATASAAYFFSQNAVQFAGNASVAYSRFGTTTTNHANYISAANDLLVSGDVEIRGSVSFGSTASVSGIFYMNDGRHRPNSNSVTAFRFQNTAGTTDVLAIDTTNTRVGVNAGGTVDTTFEVGGAASISGDVSTSARFELTSSTARFALNAGGFTDTALEVGGTGSISGNVFFGSKASISSNLQISGRFIADTVASHSLAGDLTVKRAARVGTTGYQDTTFEVGGTASVGTNFNVGEVSTGTTSVTFETKGATKGACFIITGNDGTVYYARITASGGGKWWITTVNCNQ